ncbi:MAG: hypothetical protein K0S45_2787 [Nitrospira sp.]|jgi:hypothetical protein|nr:hypothetical protein [Nitrospira sp.]
MHQDLEFEQDLPFQFQAWRLQRVGWGLLALILLAASVGLFGHGMLADATVHDSLEVLKVDYQRFLRYDTPTFFTITLPAPARTDDSVRVQLHDQYLKDVTLHEVMPAPAKVTRTAEGIEFEFHVSQSDSAVLRFSASMKTMGAVTGLIRTMDQDWLWFTHYVYP